MKLDQTKIDKVEKITLNDYKSVNGFITVENVEEMIDNLLTEIDSLKEKFRDLENKEYINEIDYDEIGKDIRFGIYD